MPEDDISVDRWKEILQDTDVVSEKMRNILRFLYACEDHSSFASVIAEELEYRGRSGVTSTVVACVKRIAKRYDVPLTKIPNGKSSYKDQWWDFFFLGWWKGSWFCWTLKENLVRAMEAMGMVNPYQSDPMALSEELSSNLPETFQEGAKRTITVNAYERDPKARLECIRTFGAVCTVCGFDFEKVYGKHGQGFIHVHHLTPVSQIGTTYQVDPRKDLRPVCPNCHAMLHHRSKGEPLEIEALKAILDNQCQRRHEPSIRG